MLNPKPSIELCPLSGEGLSPQQKRGKGQDSKNSPSEKLPVDHYFELCNTNTKHNLPQIEPIVKPCAGDEESGRKAFASQPFWWTKINQGGENCLKRHSIREVKHNIVSRSARRDRD